MIQGLTLKAQNSSPTTTPSISNGAIEVLYSAAAGTLRVQTFLPRGTGATSYPSIAQRFADGDQLGARGGSDGVVQLFRNGASIGGVTLNVADRAFFNHGGGRIGIRYNGAAGEALFDDFGGGTVP
jgi:hypothetical protein